MFAKPSHLRLAFLVFWLAAVCCSSWLFAHPGPVYAATGYNLTLTSSVTTIMRNDRSIVMTAQLTVPASDPGPSSGDFLLIMTTPGTLTKNEIYGSVTGSGTTYTLQVSGTQVGSTPNVTTGQHTFTAIYRSPVYPQGVSSNALTLTVSPPAPSSFDCGYTYTPTVALNTSITFTFSSSDPVDWQDATYEIDFAGPQAYTYTGLKSNSSGKVTVTTPDVPGLYKYRCIFGGTSSYLSTQTGWTAPRMLVSHNYLPTIHLSTNPTTLAAGQSSVWYIQLVGRSGVAAPSGQVQVYIGSNWSNEVTLGSGGTITLKTTLPSTLSSHTISIHYYGDTNYTSTSADFSLTNPPTPGNGSSTGSSTGSSSGSSTPTAGSGTPGAPATAPAQATANAQAIATGTPALNATATTTALGGTSKLSVSTSSGVPALWITLAILVLLAGGGTAGVLIWRKRRASLAP